MKSKAKWWHSPAAMAVYVFLLAGAVYAPEIAALCGYAELDCSTRKLKASQFPSPVVVINGVTATLTANSTSTFTVSGGGTSTSSGTVAIDTANGYVTTGTDTSTASSASTGDSPVIHVTGVNTLKYQTAYDVTFSSLATQTFTATYTAAGTGISTTIDGKSAFAGNLLNAQAFTLNGSTGLYIRCSTANSNDSANPMSAPYISWPLASFITSQWQANDIWVWVAATFSRTPAANYERVFVGIGYNTSSSGLVAYTSWRIRQHNIYNTGYSGNYSQHLGVSAVPSAASDYYKGGTSGAISNSFDVFAFHVINNLQVRVFFGSLTGGNWPTKSELTYLYTANIGAGLALNGGIVATDYPSIFVGAASQNTAGNADVLLTRLKIEYR